MENSSSSANVDDSKSMSRPSVTRAFSYVDESSIDHDLLCSICLRPFVDPRDLPCQHVFCKDCITKYSGTTCPTCKAPYTVASLREARMANNFVGKLQVKCPAHGAGCSWTGKRDHYAAHERACEFIDVACPNESLGCKVRTTRPALDEHLSVCVVETASPEVKELLRSMSTRSEEAKAEEEWEMLNWACEAFEIAVAGNRATGVAGGAAVYDAGLPQECHRLYYHAAGIVLAKAKSGSLPKNTFWVRILEIAMGNAKPSVADSVWGSIRDPAWIMRMAFEAILLGRHLRDSSFPARRFWDRIEDRYSMLPLARDMSLPPAPRTRASVDPSNQEDHFAAFLASMNLAANMNPELRAALAALNVGGDDNDDDDDVGREGEEEDQDPSH